MAPARGPGMAETTTLPANVALPHAEERAANECKTKP